MNSQFSSRARIRTIEWVGDRPGSIVPGRVRFIDQTRLPREVAWIETRRAEDVAEAIRTLRVRGAPAIGIAAAMGVALAAQEAGARLDAARAAAEKAAKMLLKTRPTAVNLAWAVERMRGAMEDERTGKEAKAFVKRLVREAMSIRDEDAAMCRAIGEHGVTLLRDGMAVLTHCNAGALATAEYGTALAPIYVAHERGWRIHVYADETRPHWQGARLTAWELRSSGIPVTLLCDNTAAVLMRERRVQAVLVGADRIASNGDIANKIGTYGLAQLARAHGVPFYVLAPTSSFDPKMPCGADIPIEFRDAAEITMVNGQSVAPEGVDAYAPIFDVTPAELITAIVCERGILRPPYAAAIRSVTT